MRAKDAILGIAALTLGLVLIPAVAAQAHNKVADVDCSHATVSLTSYDAHATAEMVLDGVTIQSGEFGGHYVVDIPVLGNMEHELTVDVISQDGAQYNLHFDKTTVGCYVPVLAPPAGNVVFTDGVCVIKGTPTQDNDVLVSHDATTVATYALDGIDYGVVPGDHLVVNEGSIVITLTGEDGTTLTFEHTFVYLDFCPASTPTPTPTTTHGTELAATGNDPHFLRNVLFGVLAVLLGIVGFVIGKRFQK